ncbi:hypothetical protein N0M98_05210 [Paenibacillus doosanensis]|uniref:Uncharacterized protein n=1 Tax=Paenibacillus konkukensis TaxID=2020716 RepID=A0ABY4RTT8_9BACL|nr:MULTISPECIES: hypothetical protein [Paenibacillus]MCS7459532.1 hypothetical protein [Paenibacillus doosanensis]UQZ84809.1 hypothetical protein SK3146_04064 [Paenibacillus konkukensis]
MARQTGKVPFGYVEEDVRKKARGTVWVYDSFEAFGAEQLARLIGMAEHKQVTKLVFYPLHEETLKRMGYRDTAPWYRRAEELELLIERTESPVDIVLDRFESKRKKYTPADTAFRYLAEKYASPHFVWVTAEMASKLASFESFKEWIKKLRLWIDLKSAGQTPQELHPRLREAAGRWDAVE